MLIDNRFFQRVLGASTVLLAASLLAACGGDSDRDRVTDVDDGNGDIEAYTVNATTEGYGSISPATSSVNEGATAQFTVTPDSGYTIAAVTGCDGTLDGTSYTTGAVTAACTVEASFESSTYTVTPSAGNNGSIDPGTAQAVNHSATTEFTVTPDSGYTIAAVTGCDGTLDDTTYTTSAVTAACTVEASFEPSTYTVTPSAGNNGSIDPGTAQAVSHGATTEFTVTPDSGYAIAAVTGCDGSLDGNTYTTAAITAACAVEASFEASAASGFTLTPQATKAFHFSWDEEVDATGYRLLEDPDGGSGYTEVASFDPDTTSHELQVALPKRVNASYVLETCTADDCTDSAPVYVEDSLVDAIGYIKASNPGRSYHFGEDVVLSGDGNTLVVGSAREGSSTTGINSTPDDIAQDAGAVYVFIRDGSLWSQEAYIKASNTRARDLFGSSVALSHDGNTLAVGASGEDSGSAGINSTPNTDSDDAGAVYVFTRADGDWAQQAYVKASDPNRTDDFGSSLSLSDDGDTLAVGAPTKYNGNVPGGQAQNAGAVYVFSRSGATWEEVVRLWDTNPRVGHRFGWSVAMSGDGNTLAVGAREESNDTTGVGSTPETGEAFGAGAAYIFTRDSDWDEQAYIKASNTGEDDNFGSSVALSEDGNTLAVGAPEEDSSNTGVDGTPDDLGSNVGAVYAFVRSGNSWSQQAYIKPSYTGTGCCAQRFGHSVALSDDGDTLAVGASAEGSSTTGINSARDEEAPSSGAVYVFTRDDISWGQQAFVKAFNTASSQNFGFSVGLSGDGDSLAVGARGESGSASGVNGTADGDLVGAGAAYLY